MQLSRFTLALLVLLLGGLRAYAQPERLSYFPDDVAFYATLDPGDEILARNLLLTNRQTGTNVSFLLSFDKQQWNGFAIGPRYSSIFNLKGEAGCYIRIRTRRRDQTLVDREYFLPRGRCFGVYWNREQMCWDVEENPCRAQ